MTTGADLAAAARAYLGVPWRHLGRTRQGLDCIGLLLLAARDCGLTVNDPGAYAVGHRGPALAEALRTRLVRVPLGAARDGDVLTFRDGLHVAHVGLRSTLHGRPAVIHAHTGRGRVMEEALAFQLADDLRAAYRVPGLAAP